MKINQLFIKKVENDVMMRVLHCFGLVDLNDKRLFCKFDMAQLKTVVKLTDMRSFLEPYYLPCKAKIYMDPVGMNEKRAITVLKQVLRLYGYNLVSKEKNVNNRKIIFYQLLSDKDYTQTTQMKRHDVTNVISFD